MSIEQSDEFELYLYSVENVSSLEELKRQLDQNEIDYGERYYGSHSLYYTIWSQHTLIHALEATLEANKEQLDLITTKYKILDKATLKQFEEIAELNKKIESLKINSDTHEHIKKVDGYLKAINGRINAGIDPAFNGPSRTYFNNAINELNSINKLKNSG